MRIIAGEFRSRQLVAPHGHATRPTSDRLRETLFNVVAHRIADGIFADLFAGSGAVGIEAISRGAPHVYFVENSPRALSTLRENLRALSIGADRATIISRNVASFIKSCPKPCNTVFLDPPYEDIDAYNHTLEQLGETAASACLTPDVLIIAEHAALATRKKLPPLADTHGRLTRTRLLAQGDAALSFYTRASK